MTRRLLCLLISVLIVFSAIPFTASAAAYSQQTLKSISSKLEDPYRQGGNFKFLGYTVSSNVEFDGVTAVRSITRNGVTVQSILDTNSNGAYDEGETVDLTKQLNLYDYNQLKDANDKPISIADAQYIEIEYYYDTTNRAEDWETPDANGKVAKPLTGNAMAWGQTNLSSSTSGGNSVGGGTGNVNSRNTIVENQWDRAVIEFGELYKNHSLLNQYSASDLYLRQYKLFPLGQGANPIMPMGDVLYIKSVKFKNYDPVLEESPRTWYVDFYANYADAYVGANTLDTVAVKDFATFTLPTAEEHNIENFIAWVDFNDGTQYASGEEIAMLSGANLSLYALTSTLEEITFTAEGNDAFTQQWTLNTEVTLPGAPDIIPEGKIFSGWLDSTTNTKYEAGATYNFIDPNVTFSAVFESPAAIKFFNSADDADPAFTEDWILGQTVTLPGTENIVTPENYAFVGWLDSVENDIYDGGSSYEYTNSTVYFTAVFQELVDITFTVDTDNTFTRSWLLGSDVVLPAKAEAPEHQAFTGWKDTASGIVYDASATYSFTNADTSFEAVFTELTDITFVVDDNNSFVESWLIDSEVTLPEAAEAPEGKMFKSWLDVTANVEYDAGAAYSFTNAETSFKAVFSDPYVVYADDDGAVEGAEGHVYSTLKGALDAIKDNGGFGIVKVGSNLTFNSTVSVAGISNVKIIGNTSESVLGMTKSAEIRIEGDGSSKVLIDGLVVKRDDGSNDENWFAVVSADVTFGENCTYKSGIRTTNNSTLNIFYAIGIDNTAVADTKLTINAPVTFAAFAPVAKFQRTITATGNFDFEFNNGTFSNLFLTARNGGTVTNHSTVDGNLNMVINGGTYTNVYFGGHNGGNINGFGTMTLNGGRITKFVVGDEKDMGNDSTLKNAALIINPKTIAENGYTIPKLTVGNELAYTNLAIVINNSELATDVADLSSESWLTDAYHVRVNGGSAKPVMQNGDMVFEMTADTPNYTVVAVNGEVLQPVSGGYYKLSAGRSDVQFFAEGSNPNKLIYTNGDEEFVAGLYTEGQEVLLAPQFENTDPNMVLAGYKYGDEIYYCGNSFTMPGEETVLEAYCVDNSSNVYYVSEDGSDTIGVGVVPESPFETISKAINSADSTKEITIVIEGTVVWPNPSMVSGKTVTITGKYGDVDNSENAHLLRTNKRPTLSSGTLKLKHLYDVINATTKWNAMYVKDATVETGDGYRLKIYTDAAGTSFKEENSQVVGSGNTNSDTVITTNGSMSVIALGDYNSPTFAKDVKITVNSEATFAEKPGVVLGSDSNKNTGKKTATINGKAFVTVNKNPQTDKLVVIGGRNDYGAVVHNGVQIVLNDSEGWSIYRRTNTFTANGPEYVVRSTNLVDGADVQSTTFGKVMITVPAGFTATVVDTTGTQAITETSEYTLSEGDTSVTFAANDISADIKVDGLQIRTTGTQALRFIANLNKESINTDEFDDYGFVVLPTEFLDGRKLTVGDYEYNGDTYSSAVVSVENIFNETDTNRQYTVCITDITEEYYNRKYSVVPYLKSGENYIYGEEYSASLYDAAKLAIELHNQQVEEYLLSPETLANFQSIVDYVDNSTNG